MKKITIKKCYKSFRLFDFHVFDEKVEKNFQFHIQMFGINEKGETASIIINDYKPFFYLKVMMIGVMQIQPFLNKTSINHVLMLYNQ